jgi:glc operon protein GlcG
MSNTITYTNETIALVAAQKAASAGIAAAQEMGILVSIVVVDPAGHPMAVVRMDGASILTYEVAYKKAWTAATTGAPTAGVHQFIDSDPGSLLSMPHVQNFSVVAGGLPISVDDRCVGALGVSGATAELDLKVAEAALAAIT